MANYTENFASKLDWAMPFQRTGAFPLDRSNLFETLADAQLYAQGGADKRGLGGTSYIGQMIVVYENDVVTAYIINADRSLKEMASTASVGSDVQSVLDALNEHKKAYDTKIKELEAADTALGERLDIIEGEADVEGSIKKALADAKAYADAQDVILHTTISTEIDDDVKVVSDALSGEITRAKAAEKANADAIATEKARAEGKETEIKNLLDAEVTRATEADTAHKAVLDKLDGDENTEGSVKNQIKVAVEAEKTARENADTALGNRIAKFEAGGENSVSQLKQDLAGEVSRAKAAEEVLTNNLAAEVTRAKEAEQTLTSNLTNEVNRATAAEKVLTDNLAKEIERATKAEQANAGAIAQEISDRKTVVSDLQGKIDTINSNIGENGALGAQVKANKEDIAAIKDEKTGILAQAKKYTDDELDTAIGVAPSETITGSGLLKNIADAEKSAKGYADQKIAALVNGAPETMDTLKELADALSTHEGAYEALLEVVGNKANTTDVNAELAKKVDKVEGSRLVTETEADAWDAKAEVSDVTQALTNAKGYTDSEIAKITTGNGSIGARLTAVEEKNTDQDTAIANAQAKADKGVADAAAEKTRAEAAELGLQNSIDAINNETTGILATAKSYTNTEVKKVSDKVGDINDLTTVATNTVSAINELKGNIDAINNADSGILQQAKNYTDGKVGDLNGLATTAKGSTVSAINELKDDIDNINNVNTGILVTAKNYTDTEVGKVSNKVGDIDNLATDAKGSAVLAINELKGKIDSINEDLGATGSIGTRLNNLETTVGDAESGLVKKVADNAAAIANNTTNITNNTNAIAAINNEQTGILAQAKAHAIEKDNELAGNYSGVDGENKPIAASGLRGEIESRIAAEKTRAESVEAKLREDVDKKVTKTDYDTKVAALEKADTDNLATAKAHAEKYADDLAGNYNTAGENEESNASGLRGEIESRIANEAKLRSDADKVLQGAIDAINENLGATGSIGTRLSAVEGKATSLEGRADALEAIVGHEAIPGGDGQEAQPAEGLVKDVADLKASINTLNGAADVEGSVAKTVADAVAGEATLRKAADDKLDERLGKVEASIKDGGALESRVAENERKLGVIQGESEGSIKKALEDAKAHTNTAVANLVNSAPEALDTLQELANALGDDPNFATTVATQIGTKVDKVENHRLVSTEEIAKWNAKAEVSDVTAEKDRAEAAELELKNAISTINNTNTGILAEAKKYADDQDKKLAGKYNTAAANEESNASGLRKEIEERITAEAKLRSDADTTLSNRIANKADKEHGNHVPEIQDTVSSKVFLRNDNTWAEVTPANIGAAAANHGTHVEYATEHPKAPGTAAAGISKKVAREDHVHPLQTTITGNAGTATKLATARTITVKGDATGSVSFDGSADKDLNLTLSNSGVATGSYGPTGDVAPNYKETFVVPQVTVDIKGRVTSATNRTITLPAQTVYENATSSKAGLMSNEDKAKLDGIEANANNYTHPETHDASMIIESTDKKFVSDAEKVNWNAKETTEGAQSKADAAAANALQSAKDYADQKVSDLVNDAPAAMDTLKELADAIEAHQGVYDAYVSTVSTELAKKVDKVEGSRLVTTAEANKWDAKAEVSDVTQALTNAKGYTDSEIAKIKTGEGSIGARLTAVETKNTEQDTAIKANTTNIASNKSALDVLNGPVETEGSVKKQIKDAIEEITTGDGGITARLAAIEKKNTDQDTAIANAQKQADKGVADAAAEATRAQAAEKVLTDNLATEVTRAKAAEKANSDAITVNSNAITANSNAITTNSNAITVLNGDSTVEGSVDKKIADNNIFDTDILTVNELGGIKAGENLNGMTIEEVLKKLLYPYVAHSVSASSSPNGGVFECGSNQTVTAITADITKKSEPITKVEFVDGSTVLATKTDGIAAGGLVTHSCSIPVYTNKSFTVKVTDKAGTVVTATTGGFNFVYPYYWGVCANDAVIDEAMVKGLTKKVETKGTKNVTYTADFQRAVIAYPASYGNITKILDPNSFDVTATFTKHSVNVTGLDGQSVSYNVYVNGAFTATNFKFTFSY